MVKRTTVEERKGMPLASGVLDYFPDALLVVAEVSRIGNEQHHPGEPLHWDKSKSTDEADALMRHLLDRGTVDTDGVRHSAKVAWRALALLQRELDAEERLSLAEQATTDLPRGGSMEYPSPECRHPEGQRYYSTAGTQNCGACYTVLYEPCGCPSNRIVGRAPVHLLTCPQWQP